MPTIEFSTISRSEAVSLLHDMPDGQFFTVGFVKRTTQSERFMNCRRGVTKHLTGGERAYNPENHSLLNVYSMDAQGYRSIPYEGIFEIRTNGEILRVTN